MGANGYPSFDGIENTKQCIWSDFDRAVLGSSKFGLSGSTVQAILMPRKTLHL